jgi:ATP-binding cassette subfamily G (WHITE) protein 2 (SNQ2)
MTNEFRTLDLKCANLIPRGPGYDGTTLRSQVCAIVGATPGQMTVNGLRYLKLSFNYERDHMWRVRNRFVSITSSCPRSHILVSRISAS